MTIDHSKLVPTELLFSIGGFCSGYCKVEITEQGLSHQDQGSYLDGADSQLIVPSARKWQNFYRKLAEARVQKWKRSYFDPHILDGTQWEFRLRAPDLKINTGGSNAYPPDEQWALLMRALSNLTGKRIR